MNILKKQGVAWLLTLVMIVAAIGVGRSKASAGASNPSPEPTRPSSSTGAPVVTGAAAYVCDEANVLSTATENTLENRNSRLLSDVEVVIGVVTCNYGKSDLGSYALKRAEQMELGKYDFIVVLDIKGDNYWLVQGSGLLDEGWFSDSDCSDYANRYMEESFAKGDYDGAVLSLTQALEQWYYAHN